MSVTEIWADTGEVVQREPTAEEIAQQAADEAAAAAQAAADQAAKAERDAQALSGVNKLRALGLTDAEISAMGVVIPNAT